MYEDNRKTIDWLKVILRVVICVLIFLLILKLISMFTSSKKDKVNGDIMKSNLMLLQEQVKDYFKDKIPSNVGDTSKYTLNELLDMKVIEKVKDGNNEECNYDYSYVETVRLESELQVKVNLVCNNQEDYSNNFIEIENEDKKEVTTTTAVKKVKTTTKVKTTSVKTTKKVTTTKKIINSTTTKVLSSNDIEVSFNTNGGNYIKPQIIEKNSLINYVEPVREGYNFVGWYYHGEKFDFSTKVDSNIVLVAKWTLK